MQLEQLKTRLEATGMPVAYRFFRSAVHSPFLCYLVTGSRNFAADGKVYAAFDRVRVELYTKKKDPTAEAAVEEALADCVWEKNETWIESEELFQITYEIEG